MHTRKDYLPLLINKQTTLLELAKRFECGVKKIINDLEHLSKSLKNDGYKLIVNPAICNKCSFEFSKSKLDSTRPSKCPKCRGTWISEATISIEE